MTQNFCLQCGSPMVVREIEGRPREQCPQCGWIYYLQVKLSTAVLIQSDGRLLLLQRAYEPWRGFWNLPAGYVEVDESPETAAVREVREETGLEIEIQRLLGNYFFDDDPRGNGLLVVFVGRVVGGKLNGSKESSAHGYFSPDALPEKLCGAGHSRVIQAWQRGDFQQ
jgi:8-oxo-dGTP diphosphatase